MSKMEMAIGFAVAAVIGLCIWDAVRFHSYTQEHQCQRSGKQRMVNTTTYINGPEGQLQVIPTVRAEDEYVCKSGPYPVLWR